MALKEWFSTVQSSVVQCVRGVLRWASVPDDQWPPDKAARSTVASDFGSHQYGDRRQEIVFIGCAMDEAAICQQLDEALLADDEMAKYCANWAKQQDPPHAFL